MFAETQGTIFVPIALLGWFPVTLVIFSLLPAQRAILLSLIGGWLFLPIASYDISYLPTYDKIAATCLPVTLAALLFHGQRLQEFRPKWYDAPMALLCIAPVASAITNGLGVYDGLSQAATMTIGMGLPYLIGRLFFSTRSAMSELAVAIVIGGVIYLPFCWYELRMSPQLHSIVYGYSQHSVAQQFRYGGWRPMVFMQHGLATGMWMTSASLVAYWLWQSRAQKYIFSVPMAVPVTLLVLTAVLIKSSNAIALLAMGLALLIPSKWFRTHGLVLLLCGSTVFYIGLRAAGLWDGHQLVTLIERTIGEDRAQSVEIRLQSEVVLTEKARQRPIFGWGGWGRNRVTEEFRTGVGITDSAWVMHFGSGGIVGLTAFTTSILLPVILMVRRVGAPSWASASVSPTVVLALLLALWMVDNLLNSMENPIYLVIAGGISGFEGVGLGPVRVAQRPEDATA